MESEWVNVQRGIREVYRDLAHIIHERFCYNREPSGERHGARGEYFRSETRLFPLAPSLVPLAWPVGTISRRTVMSHDDQESPEQLLWHGEN